MKWTIDHGLEDRGWYLKWCEVEALGNHSTIKMKIFVCFFCEEYEGWQKWGRKERGIELGMKKMRERKDGDTGRHEEHEGVSIPKGNQVTKLFNKINYLSFPYNSLFIEYGKGEWRGEDASLHISSCEQLTCSPTFFAFCRLPRWSRLIVDLVWNWSEASSGVHVSLVYQRFPDYFIFPCVSSEVNACVHVSTHFLLSPLADLPMETIDWRIPQVRMRSRMPCSLGRLLLMFSNGCLWKTSTRLGSLFSWRLLRFDMMRELDEVGRRGSARRWIQRHGELLVLSWASEELRPFALILKWLEMTTKVWGCCHWWLFLIFSSTLSMR